MHGTARSDVILMLMAALAVIGVALLLGQVLTVHPTIDFTQVR